MKKILTLALLIFTATAFAENQAASGDCDCWIDVKSGNKLAPGEQWGTDIHLTNWNGITHYFGWDAASSSWIDVKSGNKLAPSDQWGTDIHLTNWNGITHYFAWVPCPEHAASSTTGGVKTSGVFFRTGEVQLLAFGIGGTGQGVRNVDVPGGGTVATTRTVFVDLPQNPGLTAVTTTTNTPVTRSRNAAPIQGGFGGAGVEVKKFVTEKIGLGIEGAWLEGDSSIGTVMATVTARFPHGSNAPYLFAGGGVQFGDRTQGVGKIGGGLEHRFSPHCGIFADGAWMFSEHENAAVFRAGMSMAFGPGDPPLPPPGKYKK